MHITEEFRPIGVVRNDRVLAPFLMSIMRNIGNSDVLNIARWAVIERPSKPKAMIK